MQARRTQGLTLARPHPALTSGVNAARAAAVAVVVAGVVADAVVAIAALIPTARLRTHSPAMPPLTTMKARRRAARMVMMPMTGLAARRAASLPAQATG